MVMDTKSNISLTYIFSLLSLFLIPLMYFKTYIGPIPLSIEVILIPLLTLSFMYETYTKKIELHDTKLTIFIIPFVVYVLIACLSLINAVNLTAGIMEIMRFVSYVVTFLILAKVKFSKPQLILFGKTFIVSMVLVGLYGVAQYIFDLSLNQNGMYAIPDAKGRVMSTFVNPNYFAAFINFILPGIFIFSVIFFKDKKYQLFLFALYSLFVVNMIFTYTRASWVIMAGGLFLVLVFLFKETIRNVFKWHILVSIIVLLVGVYNLPGVESRTQSAVIALTGLVAPNLLQENEPAEEDGTSNEEDDETEKEKKQLKESTGVAVVSRTILWKTGLIMYQENPIIGVGIGNYLSRYNDVVDRNPELDLGHKEGYSVHNSYIKVMAETGTLGIISFLAIYVVYFLFLLRLYFTEKSTRILTVSLGIGSITFIMQNMTNNLFFIPQTNLMFWIIAALMINCIKNEDIKKVLSNRTY
ncbi:O-antigen ligase family protein [Metabacillus idriensis]|uniref:O-antigen ligase family protein n=1 Tax=Metabacillus idriensis TaxID=324768 RepID=UPI001CD4BC7B|nr:O-antigen ligase family protein [Metabacillus idriensis]